MKYIGTIVFIALILWLFVKMLSFVFAGQTEEVELAFLDEDFSEIEQLAARKGEIVQKLRDLEVDFNTGKINEKNYEHRRNKLEKEGVQIMRQLDEMRSGEALSEEELKRYRNNEITESSTSPNRSHSCPSCDKKVGAEDQFCKHCGESLSTGRTMEEGNEKQSVAEV